MNNSELDVFDAFGRVKAPDDAAVAKLDSLRRAKLLTLIAAATDVEEAEAAQQSAEKALHAAADLAALKREQYQAAIPRRTFMDEHRAMVATAAGKSLPLPKPDHAVETAAAEADKAEQHRLECRAALANITNILKSKRATVANAILDWSSSFPKRTTADLVRENSAREIARKMAEIRGEIEPVKVEPVTVPSHLDQVLQGQRRDINRGSRRPSPRLLPSNR